MLSSFIRIGIGVLIGTIFVKENKKVNDAYDRYKEKFRALKEKLSFSEKGNGEDNNTGNVSVD